MYWGGICFNGKVKILKIKNTLNSKTYISFLENILDYNIDSFSYLKGQKMIFMQDNASVHTSKETMNWLDNNPFIEILKWPAKIPDLNPIENLWGYLTQKVFRNKKQLESTDDLEMAIYDAWESIDTKYIKNLIESMPKRIGMVLMNRGIFINNY